MKPESIARTYVRCETHNMYMYIYVACVSKLHAHAIARREEMAEGLGEGASDHGLPY